MVLSLEAASAIVDVGVNSMAAVSTGCVDGVSGALCSAILSASYITAAVVAKSLGSAGSLGVGSLGILDTGLLAVYSSVVFSVHVEALSAIVTILVLSDLLIYSVARFGLLIDLCAAFVDLVVRSPREA